MGFNSGFKGLILRCSIYHHSAIHQLLLLSPINNLK